jgi:hypothetical protein
MVRRYGFTAWVVPAFAAVAFIAVMTLQPAAGPPTPLPFVCLFCGSLGGVDFLLNVVLFVPLGLSLYHVFSSAKKTLAAGILYTLLIETMQWRFIPGRDASMGDLIANSAGTAIGIALALVSVHALHATGRLARRMAGAFAVMVSLVVFATGALLQPISVRYGLAVQWKVPRPNMDTFKGELQSVSLNGEPLVAAQWVSPRAFRDRNTGAVNLEARIGSRVEPSVRQAIIVRLASYLEEGLYLGQWGTSVVMRTHQVAELVRFRPLLVSLDGALSAPAVSDGHAGSITIIAMSNSRAVSLARSGSGEELRTTMNRTIGLGWTLIMPWDVRVTPAWWFANTAWLGALILPVAFFTLRSRRHQSSPGVLSLWPLLAAVGVMAVFPRWLGLSGLSLAEWFGIAAGIAFGSGLEKLIPTDTPMPLNPVASNGTIHT